MYADSAAAFGTSPSRLFASNKSSYSPLSYVVEIFNHAHTVSGSISFVQVFQIAAGEPGTFKTIFRFSIFKGCAVFNSASNNGNSFIDIRRSATGAFIFLPEICHAYTAVHTAWGD
jgi:hypothetical protein